MADLYPTSVNERGRRFSREKLYKGQRPLGEEAVEFHRMVARESPNEGERERALEWLAEYEEMGGGCESS